MATYHAQRMARLEKKLLGLGTEYCAGSQPTYADLFIYTCVQTVLKCKGLGRSVKVLKSPFDNYPTVVALANKIGERPKVAEKAGKFEECPV